METSKTKKTSSLFAMIAILTSALAWFTPNEYYRGMMENQLIKSLKEKLHKYNSVLPEDRLYVQADKPLYAPGDDIWLSAFIRNGSDMKPSSVSEIVHLELINPKGTVEKKIAVLAKNGKAAADFKLDKEVSGGLYKIKAYTKWMKNLNATQADEEIGFTKNILVQEVMLPNLKMKLDFEKKAFGPGDEVIAKIELHDNSNKQLKNHLINYVVSLKGQKIFESTETTDEDGMKYVKFKLPNKLSSSDALLNIMVDHNGNTESISRSIPIVLNHIRFSTFPEGGNLVCGLENNVAFRALNEFNKPADVEGIVLNEKGERITAFSSYHQGMGAFKFKPQPNEKYLVQITKPLGIEQTFRLGEATERGYALSVDNSKKDELTVIVNTSEYGELAVVAQVRGKVYYNTLINCRRGSNKFTFKTDNFPMGVAQITVFDGAGIPRAERLSFVNKHKKLKISVETEKQKYLPREKVKMTLTVKDERGLPMPANLSMAVVNDQLLSFADDKSGNILSELLLQQDLKEKIEEPAFYFNQKEKKADKALDYLLLTSGWRRFTWEKIIDEEIPSIQFAGEKAIIAGTVLDGSTKKPLANALIKTSDGKELRSDANGKFSIKQPDLSQSITLTFSHDAYQTQTRYLNDYVQDQKIQLHKNDYRRYPNTKRIRLEQDFDIMLMEDHHVPMAEEGFPMLLEAAPMLDELAGVPGQALQRQRIVPQNKASHKNLEERNNQPLDALAPFKHAEKKKEAIQQNGKREAAAQVGGKRFDQERAFAAAEEIQDKRGASGNKYYRARQFHAPVYEREASPELRSDFRNTIYWNPNIEVGYSGSKTIEFYASDDITSFRATVEGIGADGNIGRTEHTFFAQLPFSMKTKIPVEVATEDVLSIPLTLQNNTGSPLGGVISVTAPAGLREMAKLNPVQTIMPGATKTIYLDYKVSDVIGEGEFTIAFKACGLEDAFVQKIKIIAKGFPVESSFSGQEIEKEYFFEVNNLVKGSLKAHFNAFPNVISDLMKGIEGILQEPYGCFEQTSCTAYPNAMVLDYLKSSSTESNKSMSRAIDLMDRGYKRLTGFECKDRGYEWFGANPAHEGLTAYGIMEFVDMKKAGQDVDQKMLDRTADWLLSHKDGQGGFRRETHAYHDFGRINNEVLNGYIVYALAEAGYRELEKEFESSCKKALENNDAYLLALMSNAAFSLGKKSKGESLLKAMLAKQGADGSICGNSHSITYSQGRSLSIETTALSILAILKSEDKDQRALGTALKFLLSCRSGSGVFSSTQGTILALKALTEYAKYNKKTTENGQIVLYIDGIKAGEQSYKAGDKGSINIDHLEQYIQGEGRHSIKVKYLGVKNPLPYAISIKWSTSLPKRDAGCAVDLLSVLSATTVGVGETVRLSTTLTNKRLENIPSTMAIIGIPAGFTAQPWQLKELQDKKVFDYYEIKGNNIAVYYRGLASGAIKEINLDLKAELPGVYDAPASCAYLYYTNEFKTWCASNKITIKKTNI